MNLFLKFKSKSIKKSYLFLFFLFLSLGYNIKAQSFVFDLDQKDLSFLVANKTVLIDTGNSGLNAGSVHKYANVITLPDENNVSHTIYATIKIVSLDNITISNFDVDTGDGKQSFFQPTITATNPPTQGLVTYRMEFFDTATDEPIYFKNFTFSGLDTDGDSGTGRELYQIKDYTNYQLDSTTKITVSTVGDYTQFLSSTDTLPGIEFDNTASFMSDYDSPVYALDFKLGSTSNVANRQFSTKLGTPAGTFTTPIITTPTKSQNDLQVTKTLNNLNPTIGSNVIFTITAKNNGPTAGTNVRVTDLLPSGYTYVSSVVPGGNTYNSTSGVWAIGNLSNGASAVLTITGKVMASGNYTNYAVITGNQEDTNFLNNIAYAEPNAKLTITKTSSPTGNVLPGDIIDYTMVVTNTGYSDAKNVTLKDVLPPGLTYVAGTAQKTYNVTTTLAGTATKTFSGVSVNRNSNTVQNVVFSSGDIPVGATLTGFQYKVNGNSVSGNSGRRRDVSLSVSSPGGLLSEIDRGSDTDDNEFGTAGGNWTADVGRTITSASGSAVGTYAFTFYDSRTNGSNPHQNNISGSITINYTYLADVTTANAANAPQNMVITGDGVILQPGKTLTVTFKALVGNTAVGSVANTATAAADNVTGTVSATATNFVINPCKDGASTDGTSTATDSDGDGFNDICDLDDDNDGILDVDEGAALLVHRSLSYEFYNTNSGNNVDNIPTTGATKTGVISNFDVTALANSITPVDLNTFSVRYTGYINIQKAGSYTFYTTSDDGSKLFIDGTQVVDNNGLHGSKEEQGTVSLTVGFHAIRVLFFENTGGQLLEVRYSSAAAGIAKTEIPFTQLYTGTYTDTDNDGIPDYLDLDSDNDGCLDAIEGDENVLPSQLVNAASLLNVGTGSTASKQNLCTSGSCVDTDGVPTRVNSGGSADIGGDKGQGFGSSRNAAINTCIDSDGDGYPDDIDMDSDNDGILDIDELFQCTLVPSTNSAAVNIVDGNTQSLTLSGEKGFGFDVVLLDNSFNITINGTQLAINGTAPYPNDFNFQSPHNVQFVGGDKYGVNPIPNIYSFAEANPATPLIRFLYNANDKTLQMFGSKTLNGTLQPMELIAGLTLNTVTWNRSSNNIITIGQAVVGPTNLKGTMYGVNLVKPCTNVDTDGDGIPDHLDTDADGDGCADAIEGTENVKKSQIYPLNLQATDPNYKFRGQIKVIYDGVTTGTSAGVISTSTNASGVPQLVNNAGNNYNATTNPSNLAGVADNTDSPTPTSEIGQGAGNSANATINDCICYKSANLGGPGSDSKVGITLLQRAGSNNGNWPMIRKSALTVLESNTKGFVITRLTTTQITNLVSPQKGMMVYDTVAKCLKLYNGTTWSCFSTPSCPDVL
ncbi:PA14 domain-containing protein [Halpernia sp.]|uniref:PA14 domain-containing protein n=1 Tax=Halpernia sp. TaxID=2782209 RepID=UPI003A8CC07C